MTAYWQHLSWSHATAAVLLVVIVAGYVLTDSVEDPRAWRLLRDIRRRFVARRARRLRREVIEAPWDGAIVKRPTYYTPHWNGAVGRAYRGIAAQRRTLQ